MLIVYVGDSGNVSKRIRRNHCGGNVEASALRRHVAERKGFPIKKTRRPSGSRRVRLDLPDPKAGEEEISAYLRSGMWKLVICDSPEEARDFQWYVIEALNPLLNVDRQPWNTDRGARYQSLLAELTGFPCRSYRDLETESGPGVYVFYHERAT